MFLYKAILHKLPNLCCLLAARTNSTRITQSSSFIMYKDPRTDTQLLQPYHCVSYRVTLNWNPKSP